MIVRTLALAAAAIVLCSFARAEDARPIENRLRTATKIGVRELAECLKTGADKAYN